MGIDPSGEAKKREREVTDWVGSSQREPFGRSGWKWLWIETSVRVLSYLMFLCVGSEVENSHTKTHRGPTKKGLRKEHDWYFEHVVVIWCNYYWLGKPLARAVSGLIGMEIFPRRNHDILSYLCWRRRRRRRKKKDNLCKFRYAFAIVIQLFSPVV